MAMPVLVVEGRVPERRELFAELTEIANSVRDHSLHDRVSLYVSDWQGRFHEELRRSDDRARILHRYAEELKIELIDPVEGAPLEEVSYLGSDGGVYGDRALSCYLSELEEVYKGRSPLRPLERKRLFVVKHLVVEAAVRFLAKRGLAEPLPHRIETCYQNLVREGRVPEKQVNQARVKLQDELDLLQDAIRIPIDDMMAVRIKTWHGKFIEELSRSDNVDEVRGRYIRVMQEMFCDSIAGSPLEKESYLGNDDQVYGKRALYVYLEKRALDKMTRSPKSPDVEEMFTVQRHPIVEAVFAWLKKQDSALLPTERITRCYKELKAIGLPRLPTTRRIVLEEERGYIERNRPREEAEVPRAALPFEHTPRMRIRAELAIINDLLRLPFTDETTRQIHDWHGRFVLAIRNLEDPSPIIEEFKTELVAIIGPFAEKISYLGSDGIVYGKKRLYVSLEGMFPELIVQRHFIVEGLFLWLRRHGVHLTPSVEIVEAYQKIKALGLPELPTDPVRVQRQARIRRVREARLERERREREAREAAQKAAEDAARGYVDGVFGEFDEEARRIEAEERARAEAARQRDLEREEELRREEEGWTDRNEALQKRLDELDGRVDRIWQDVGRTEGAISRLEASIQATTKAIQDKNDRDEKNAWGTIAKVAAYAAASYATDLAISEATGGGGFIIGKTWAI